MSLLEQFVVVVGAHEGHEDDDGESHHEDGDPAQLQTLPQTKKQTGEQMGIGIGMMGIGNGEDRGGRGGERKGNDKCTSSCKAYTSAPAAAATLTPDCINLTLRQSDTHICTILRTRN